MAVLKLGTSDKDLGEWFDYPKIEGVKIRIRKLPRAKANELKSRYLGRHRMVGNQGTKVDSLKLDEFGIAVAVYCATDIKGLDLEVQPSSVEEMTKALGREVGVGEVVKMDGHWSDAARELFFTDDEACETWINKKVKAIREADDQEEEEALGN